MKKRAVIVFVALLALATTPRGMAPLPAQYLHGSTFHAPDGWYKVDGPGGWEWFEMRAFDGDADPRWPDAVHQTVAWMARDPSPKTLDSFVVMETYNPAGSQLDDDYIQSFETYTRTTLQPGESMTGFSVERLSIPTEGSIHYSYKFIGKTKKPQYRLGYISGSEHRVALSTSRDTPGEPKWFTRMVVSLRWLKEP